MTAGEIVFEPVEASLNGYVEDTIVVDWQTPIVDQRARELTAGMTRPEDRLRALYTFVRDEIHHSLDIETDELTCSASEVLRKGHGLCYAKSHLLVAMARRCGIASGFGFQRLRSEHDPARFALHGFMGVHLASEDRWAALDPRGNTGGIETEFDLLTPSLAFTPDPELGEATWPEIYSKPSKRVVETLSKAGSLERARRSLPDSL